MKKNLIVFLLMCLAATIASAELLVTANPLGQGKWGVLGAYLSDSNASNVSTYGLNTMGGFVGYGINDKLDVYVNLGSANMTGLPAGTSISLTGYGIFGKYALITEGEQLPVSVAAAAGLRSIGTKQTAVADTSSTQVLVGAGVSKMMIPFVPYGGLIYRSTSTSGSTATQFDLTAGSAIAWSEKGAVYMEYTLQSIRTAAGVNYTSPQIGLGVGYLI